MLPHLCFTLWESMTTTDNVSHDSITIVIPFTVGWTTGRAVEACTGLKLAGFPRLPRDSHGFVLIHCGNPATMGLMSQESHWYGMGRLRESSGADRLKVVMSSAQEVTVILQFWNAKTTVWHEWQKSPVDSLVCRQLAHTQSVHSR